MPTSVGISPREQGEEETTGGETRISKTGASNQVRLQNIARRKRHRCSKGNNTSSPGEISPHPNRIHFPRNEKRFARDDSGSASTIQRKPSAAQSFLRPGQQKLLSFCEPFGKSVSSFAATSPLLPRARRMRAIWTHRGVSEFQWWVETPMRSIRGFRVISEDAAWRFTHH